MSFFDELWTQNHQIPDKITLTIFVVYRLILVLVFIGFYYFTKYRITESIKGPFPESSLTPPSNLLFSLKLIYLSCILLEFSTILTHISALIDNNGRYLMVGEEDVVFLTAMLLNLYGIYIFGFVLHNKDQTETFQIPKFGMYLIVILTIGTYLSSILSQIEGESGDLVTFVLGSLVILTLLYLNLKTTLTPTKNPVLTIRKRMLVFITLAWVVFPVVLFLFFIPDGILTPLITSTFDLSAAPTRTFFVEFLFLSVDFFSITIGFVVWSIIYLPYWIRKLNGLGDEQYYENFDYRFDFDWTRKRHIISSLNAMPEYQSSIEDSPKYIMSYDNPDDKQTLQRLNTVFPGNIIHSSSIDEETMQLLFLKTHDFILLDSAFSEMTEELLDYIQRTYFVEISLKDTITLFQRFRFQSDDFKYAFLGIFPAYWNTRRKLWLLYAKSHIHDALIKFLEDFHTYFVELSFSKAVFAILKFPVTNGEIQSILPISKGLNIPDSRYIKII